MNEITIPLPYPPSVNHYKRVGRTIKTASGKMYQQKINTSATNRYYYEVWMKIRNLMRLEGVCGFYGEAIELEVHVYPPDKRKRDLDGILKVLLDSLQRGGLFDDDYQIARLLVERKHIIAQGEIIVRVKLYVP